MKKGLVVALLVAAIVTAAASAMSFSSWSPAASAESISGTSTDLNTSSLEGCPFVAQRGDILYFASNREGSIGGSIDIWYSVRLETGGWGTPVNLTAVNSTSNELCPAAHRNGKDFLFVSNRPGWCGSTQNEDIWRTRLHATRGWATPSNLGCTVNSAANEASPYLLESELYFGSDRAGGFSSEAPGAVSGDADIYTSAFDGSSFSAPVLAAGLNTERNEFRPNLRRDGLEIFFDSNRTGSLGSDIWTATRASTANPWPVVTRLDSNVNGSANEVRPSLSWDGTTLYFGSNRAGSLDLYFSTRSKLTGP